MLAYGIFENDFHATRMLRQELCHIVCFPLVQSQYSKMPQERRRLWRVVTRKRTWTMTQQSPAVLCWATSAPDNTILRSSEQLVLLFLFYGRGQAREKKTERYEMYVQLSGSIRNLCDGNQNKTKRARNRSAESPKRVQWLAVTGGMERDLVHAQVLKCCPESLEKVKQPLRGDGTVGTNNDPMTLALEGNVFRTIWLALRVAL